MGTTSEKLTYLNDTKQLLKENINNLGGNLTNEPFRQYASVLEGIYERLPKVSGIGASLSLSPSMVGKIKLNEIQGDTLQENTPTPSSPVPIESVTGLQNVEVCGKNLLPYPFFNNTTTTTNGITFTPQTDGSVFVKGTATGQATFALYGNYEEINQKPLTGNYISGGSSNVKIRILNHTGSSYTGLGTDTGNGVQIDKTTYNTGYIELLVSSGTNLQNGVFVRPMMLNSLSDTTFESYSSNTYEVNLGNIELNKIGNYQDSIKKSTGKNLFDKDTIIEGKYIDASGNFINDNNNFIGDFISIDNTKSYYISALSGQPKRIVYYDSSKSFISRELITATGGALTIPNNTRYVRLSCYNQDLNTLQLEQGTSSSSYEPYGKVWYITENMGEVVFDGSESYASLGGSGSNPYYVFYNNNTLVSNSKVNSTLYSNYFIVDNTSGLLQRDGGCRIAEYNSVNRLFFCIHSITSVNDFKTWLSTHNTTVLYQLATPTYEVITNTELIEQLESLNNAKSEDGTTNINVTSEDLSMILNVGVLKGE